MPARGLEPAQGQRNPTPALPGPLSRRRWTQLRGEPGQGRRCRPRRVPRLRNWIRTWCRRRSVDPPLLPVLSKSGGKELRKRSARVRRCEEGSRGINDGTGDPPAVDVLHDHCEVVSGLRLRCSHQVPSSINFPRDREVRIDVHEGSPSFYGSRLRTTHQYCVLGKVRFIFLQPYRGPSEVGTCFAVAGTPPEKHG